MFAHTFEYLDFRLKNKCEFCFFFKILNMLTVYYLPPLKSDADDEEYAEIHLRLVLKIWSIKSNLRLWPINNLWAKQCILSSIQSPFHLMSPWCCSGRFGLFTARSKISEVLKFVSFARTIQSKCSILICIHDKFPKLTWS